MIYPAYKLVYRLGPETYSFSRSYAYENKCIKKYKIGSFVRARYGGLLCFSNQNNAINFAAQRKYNSTKGNIELWKCSGLFPVKLEFGSSHCIPISLAILRNIWEGINKERNFPWPEGTLAFKMVRLDSFIDQLT